MQSVHFATSIRSLQALSAVVSISGYRYMGCEFNHSLIPYFAVINHEIIIGQLLLPLFQEGLLSITSERM